MTTAAPVPDQNGRKNKGRRVLLIILGTALFITFILSLRTENEWSRAGFMFVRLISQLTVAGILIGMSVRRLLRLPPGRDRFKWVFILVVGIVAAIRGVATCVISTYPDASGTPNERTTQLSDPGGNRPQPKLDPSIKTKLEPQLSAYRQAAGQLHRSKSIPETGLDLANPGNITREDLLDYKKQLANVSATVDVIIRELDAFDGPAVASEKHFWQTEKEVCDQSKREIELLGENWEWWHQHGMEPVGETVVWRMDAGLTQQFVDSLKKRQRISPSQLLQ